MKLPVQQRSKINIKATVQQHQAFVPGMLAAHALSGCDTAPSIYGLSRGTMLKILTSLPDSLTKLGCFDATLQEVMR